MTSSESFSSAFSNDQAFDGHEPSRQLLDLDEVIQSGDLDLLSQQLKAAHRLLAHRDELVDSLTEKLHLTDASKVQIQEEAAALRQQCESQQEEVTELQSVCADLRSLLKRLQRRTPQKPQPQQNSGHTFEMSMTPIKKPAKKISLGYESNREPLVSATPSTKAPPVKAWSAHDSGILHEEVIFCQKLSTLMVTSQSQVHELSPTPRSMVMAATNFSQNSAVQLPEIAAG